MESQGKGFAPQEQGFLQPSPLFGCLKNAARNWVKYLVKKTKLNKSVPPLPSPPHQLPATCFREKADSTRCGVAGRFISWRRLMVQFGPRFQYSLVMFYNPDPWIMASFTTLLLAGNRMSGSLSQGGSGLWVIAPRESQGTQDLAVSDASDQAGRCGQGWKWRMDRRSNRKNSRPS